MNLHFHVTRRNQQAGCVVCSSTCCPSLNKQSVSRYVKWPHTLHMVVRSETEMHIALSNSTVNLSIPNLIQILF
jgi:hypothetical protein